MTTIEITISEPHHDMLLALIEADGSHPYSDIQEIVEESIHNGYLQLPEEDR